MEDATGRRNGGDRKAAVPARDIPVKVSGGKVLPLITITTGVCLLLWFQPSNVPSLLGVGCLVLTAAIFSDLLPVPHDANGPASETSEEAAWLRGMLDNVNDAVVTKDLTGGNRLVSSSGHCVPTDRRSIWRRRSAASAPTAACRKFSP